MIEDNIIQYDDETKRIYFIGNITSFVFYNQLFKALREHYKQNGVEVAPIFSFIYVERFDPLVVPNLISVGLLLKNIHNNKPTHLEIARTLPTKFLDDGWFFRAVGHPNIFSEEISDEDGIQHTINQKTGYEIYDFEPKLLGFYNNSNVSESYNARHRVYVFREDSYSYYSRFNQDNVTEKELNGIRTDKLIELEPFIEKRYGKILHDEEKGGPTLNIKDAQVVSAILTELITNAVLYSGSHCSAMLQRIGNITKISISDGGVGFGYSLEKKKEKFGKEYRNVFDEFSAVEQTKYKNLLYIFQTLSYSKEKEESTSRENLFTLLKTVLKKQGESEIQEGTIRIHFNDTQVIMTSNSCSKCEEIIPQKCVKCLLKNYNPATEVSKSNLRFFEGLFKGVHIEVELKF